MNENPEILFPFRGAFIVMAQNIEKLNALAWQKWIKLVRNPLGNPLE